MSVNPIPARKGRAFLFALTIFVLSVRVIGRNRSSFAEEERIQ
jgi:hypothetical protein